MKEKNNFIEDFAELCEKCKSEIFSTIFFHSRFLSFATRQWVVSMPQSNFIVFVCVYSCVRLPTEKKIQKIMENYFLL